MVLFRLIWCNYPTIINYQPGWVSRSGTKLFRWSSKATERLPLRQAALFQVCSSLSLGGFLQGGSSFMEVMQKWGGEPATKLMHLVLTPLSIFMSIYSILLVAGISASWVWKILGGCVNEKCALTRHTSDRRRLCKRCVTEKNLSWLAAAILPILSDSSWPLESLPRRDVY